ncbi:hypothetical protein ACFX13_036359 [Malus domestica]
MLRSHTRRPTHFIEDNVKVHDDSSAFCLQIPLDREKAWPFLLDKPSWDESNEREMNFADNDVEILDGDFFVKQLHIVSNSENDRICKTSGRTKLIT